MRLHMLKRLADHAVSAVIKSRRLDDVVILDISGRITLGEGAVTLRDALQKLLNGGDRKVVMNLEDVDYIDSAGLGELVTAFTIVRAHGRTTEAAQAYTPHPRPSADHQAADGLRCLRQRNGSHQVDAIGGSSYAAFTCIVRPFELSFFGSVIDNSPFLKSAVTRSPSIDAGSAKERLKAPHARSIRW